MNNLRPRKVWTQCFTHQSQSPVKILANIFALVGLFSDLNETDSLKNVAITKIFCIVLTSVKENGRQEDQ